MEPALDILPFHWLHHTCLSSARHSQICPVLPLYFSMLITSSSPCSGPEHLWSWHAQGLPHTPWASLPLLHPHFCLAGKRLRVQGFLPPDPTLLAIAQDGILWKSRPCSGILHKLSLIKQMTATMRLDSQLPRASSRQLLRVCTSQKEDFLQQRPEKGLLHPGG